MKQKIIESVYVSNTGYLIIKKNGFIKLSQKPPCLHHNEKTKTIVYDGTYLNN